MIMTAPTATPTTAPSTAATLDDLEALRRQRIQEAQDKNLLEKIILAVERVGERRYFHGRHYLLTIFPHPANAGDTVRVLAYRQSQYDKTIGTFVSVESAVVWVHPTRDVDDKEPVVPRPSWITVFRMGRVVPQNSVVKPQHQDAWTYIPGNWETPILRAAQEAIEAINEARRQEQEQKAQKLISWLFAPRPV